MTKTKTTTAHNGKIENPIETLKIKALDKAGNGIATTQDGRSIKVPFALPGEVVSAGIIETRNENERWAEVLEIKKQNEQRKKPMCAHFGTCGGCSLQHMNDDLYKEYKRENVINILKDYGVKINKDIVESPIIFGPGKRRRINFTARVLRDGTFVMGFSRKNRRSLFDVYECKATVDSFQPLFSAFRGLLSSIMEKGEKIHIFLTDAENGVDVFVGGIKYHLCDELKQRFVALSRDHDLSRLIVKQKNKRETIWQKDGENPPYVEFSGYRVEVAANAFLQASVDADKTLADLVYQHIPDDSKKIADLFAGRGTLTFPIVADKDQRLGKLKAVDAFECDDHALCAFEKAITLPQNRDTKEKEQKIDKITVHNRNLFINPLRVNEIDSYDFICLDPPRAGCKEQVEEIIKSTKLQTIVYVSCSNESFARDANILMNCGGFELSKLYPVDQFLWTPHIEIVGVFKRKV